MAVSLKGGLKMLTMNPYPYRSKRSRRPRWGKALAVFSLLLGILVAVVIGLYIQLSALFRPETPDTLHEAHFTSIQRASQFSGPIQLESDSRK